MIVGFFVVIVYIYYKEFLKLYYIALYGILAKNLVWPGYVKKQGFHQFGNWNCMHQLPEFNICNLYLFDQMPYRDQISSIVKNRQKPQALTWNT